jgi:threonine/homoserine/homoserine lactone efflux protein
MNRAILIILIPALLVAAGYIFVLRTLGLAPSYLRLIVPAVLLFGAIYWLSRKGAHKTNTERQ